MVWLALGEGGDLGTRCSTSLQESLVLPCGCPNGVHPSWQGKAGPVLTRPLPDIGSSEVAEKGGKIWGLGRASRAGHENPGPNGQHKQVSSRAVPSDPQGLASRGTRLGGLRRDPISVDVVALDIETHVSCQKKA